MNKDPQIVKVCVFAPGYKQLTVATSLFHGITVWTVSMGAT